MSNNENSPMLLANKSEIVGNTELNNGHTSLKKESMLLRQLPLCMLDNRLITK